MSISLIVSGLGAVLAAIGSGVLLARCFRAPRGDLIYWSVALLGLLVSLGSQTLGYLVGFDASMFRAMELGAQVIAPLALILALSEVAARSTPVRFCSKLYISALACVAVVVLLLDQLTDAAFSKTWPDPATHYQIAPEYVLYALGVVTALIAIIAMATVARRASRPGWNAVLPGQLAGGAAALLLAYPEIAMLAAHEASLHLPVSSLFVVLCAMAVGLTWLAGVFTGRVPLAQLRGRDAGGRGAGGFELAAEQGQYGGGGLYRQDPADNNDGYYRDGEGYYRDGAEHGGGWRDDQAARDRDEGWRGADGRSAGQQDWRREGEPHGGQDDWYRREDNGPDGADDWRRHEGAGADDWREDRDGYLPDYATGDFATGDFVTGEHDPGYPADGRQAGAAAASALADDREFGGRHYGGRPDGRTGQPGGSDDAERAQLFGQIAIYTLLEDRVAEFDQLAERVVGQVRNREPDALVYIVHAVPSAPMQRILYEVYRDRAAYQRHVRQPHVVQFETDRRPYVLATNVIELGLQQAKVSPFPSVDELFGEPGYDTSGFERPDYLRDYGREPAPGGQRDLR